MAGVFRRRGRWCADYRDAAGRRHREFRRTKAQAAELLAQRVQSIVGGSYQPEARTATVEMVACAWLEAKTPTWKATTRELNTGAVRRYLLNPTFGIGRLRIAVINLATCERFRARMVEACPQLSPRTVNMAMTALSAVLTYAQRCHLRSDNPCRFIPKLKEARREVEVLTPAQAEELVAAAGSPRDAALIELALLTGARFGELTALCWQHFSDRSLAVSGTNSHREQRRRFLVSGTWDDGAKTAASARQIILSPRAVHLLREWRLRSGNPGSEALVFANEHGHPIDGGNWRRRVWRPALVAAGLPLTLSVHSLRHCYASRMLSEGATLELVARQLGHSNVNITARIYRHWIVDRDAEQAALIDRAMDIAGTSTRGSTPCREGTHGSP